MGAKRSTYRRRRRRTKRSSYPRIRKNLLGTTFTTKMRYCDSISVNPAGSGALSIVEYNCNSPYDPQTSTGGHASMGFSQIMPLYQRYCVTDARISLRFSNVSGTGTDHYICGIALRGTTSALSSFTLNDIREQPHTQWGYLEPVGSKCGLKLASNVCIWKWLGLKSRTNLLSVPNCSGNDSGSPTEGVIWDIFVTSVDGSTDVSTVYIDLTIDYVVTFLEPRQLDGS